MRSDDDKHDDKSGDKNFGQDDAGGVDQNGGKDAGLMGGLNDHFGNPDEILAVVRASAGRRFLGITCLGGLGILLLYMAVVQPPAPGFQVFLVVLGAAALWCADAMRRGTASEVQLTPEVLRDADGTVIARVADIAAIDRGFFAFKPSNGFLLKLQVGEGRMWRPGLWWRMGRRVGIGGMTPGSQTKFMSEIIATMLATRKDPH